MQRVKKMLAIFTTFALVMGLVSPFGVIAEETEGNAFYELVQAEDDLVTDYGDEEQLATPALFEGFGGGVNLIQNADFALYAGWAPAFLQNWRNVGLAFVGLDGGQGFRVAGDFPDYNYTTGYEIDLVPGVYRLSAWFALDTPGPNAVMYLRPSGGGNPVPGSEITLTGIPWTSYETEFTVTDGLTNLQLYMERPGHTFWLGPVSLVRIGDVPGNGDDNGGTPGVLTGTPFANAGSSNPLYAFDGDLDTAFLSNTSDYTHGVPGYIGLNLGGANWYKLTAVRVHPVVGDMDEWHTAAFVQGSVDGTTWETLVGSGDDAGGYWIRNIGNTQAWFTLPISDDTPFRHFRLVGGANHSILIRYAEVEFIGYRVDGDPGDCGDCGVCNDCLNDDCNICGTCDACLLLEGRNRILNGDFVNTTWLGPPAYGLQNWRQTPTTWTGFEALTGGNVGDWHGYNYTSGYTITLEPGVYRLTTWFALNDAFTSDYAQMYLRPYGGGTAVVGTTTVMDQTPWTFYETTFTVTSELTGLQLFISRPNNRQFWQGPTRLVRIGGDPEPERPPDSNVDGDLIFHLNNDSLYDTWFVFGNNPDVGVIVTRPTNVYYGLGALRVTTDNGHGGFEIHFYHSAPWMANLTLEPHRHYHVTGVTRVTGTAPAGIHVGIFHRNALAFFENDLYPFNVLPMGDDWTEFSFDVFTQPNHSGGFGFVMRGNNLTDGAFYFANMRVYDMGALGPIECPECGEYGDDCICCPDCARYPCACPPVDWDVEFIFGNIFNEGDASVANSFNNGGWSYNGVTVTSEGRGTGENALRLNGFVGFHPVALEPNTEYRVRVLARNAEPGALIGPQRPLIGVDTDAGHNKISFQYNSASEDAEGFSGDRHNLYITSTDFEWVEITFTTPADIQPNWSQDIIVVFAMRASTAWIQEFIVERVSDGENIFNNGNSDISGLRFDTTWEGSFNATREGQGLPTNTVRVAPGGYGQVELPIEAGRVYDVRVLARGNGNISIGGVLDIQVDSDEWVWHITTLNVPFDFDDINAYIAMHATSTDVLWVEGIIVIDQNPPARPATINVDPTTTFQEIEGMGFFGPEGVWWESWWRDMHSPEWIDEILIDMGVTMWRNEVYSLLNPACGVGENPHLNPDCTGTYFCCLSDIDRPLGNQDTWWELQRPVVVDLWNRAQELEVDFRIILSVWSPPGQWKDNGTTKNGGTLLPQYYEAYGHWWVAALDMYREEGIEIYAISLQNEPMFAQGFSSMVMTAEEYINMLLVTVPIIKAAYPDVLIFGAECMLAFQNGWAMGGIFNYNQRIEANLRNTSPGDPGSLHGLFDRFAVHGYYDGVIAEAIENHRHYWTQDRINHTMRPRWMTETSGYGYHWLDQVRTINNWTGSIPGALNLGMAMQMALLYGDLPAWVYWQGFNHETDSIYNLWSPYDNRNKYAVSQHFFRYLRPGTVRIDSSVTGTVAIDDLLVTAYRDDNYERYVVIVVNSSEFPHVVDINGFGDVEFAMYFTTADESINFERVDTLLPGDGILIPAHSVVTLVADMDEVDLPPDEYFCLGDVNRDGFVNQADVDMLLGFLQGSVSADDLDLLLADIDQDGDVTTVDWMLLDLMAQGWILPWHLGCPCPPCQDIITGQQQSITGVSGDVSRSAKVVLPTLQGGVGSMSSATVTRTGINPSYIPIMPLSLAGNIEFSFSTAFGNGYVDITVYMDSTTALLPFSAGMLRVTASGHADALFDDTATPLPLADIVTNANMIVDQTFSAGNDFTTFLINHASPPVPPAWGVERNIVGSDAIDGILGTVRLLVPDTVDTEITVAIDMVTSGFAWGATFLMPPAPLPDPILINHIITPPATNYPLVFTPPSITITPAATMDINESTAGQSPDFTVTAAPMPTSGATPAQVTITRTTPADTPDVFTWDYVNNRILVNAPGLPVGTHAVNVTVNTGIGASSTPVSFVFNAIPIPVTSITVTPSPLAMVLGTTAPQQLSIIVLPANATDQTITSTTWISGDTAVATVSATGVVTAVGEGTTTITVTAITGDGPFTATATVIVTLTPEAPVITPQPTNQTVTAGQTATFTSGATGVPTPLLQWQISTDGGTTWTDISGATNPTLQVTNTTLAMSGNQFQLVATSAAGSVTSAPATLTVNPVPQQSPQPTTPPQPQQTPQPAQSPSPTPTPQTPAPQTPAPTPQTGIFSVGISEEQLIDWDIDSGTDVALTIDHIGYDDEDFAANLLGVDAVNDIVALDGINAMLLSLLHNLAVRIDGEETDLPNHVTVTVDLTTLGLSPEQLIRLTGFIFDEETGTYVVLPGVFTEDGRTFSFEVGATGVVGIMVYTMPNIFMRLTIGNLDYYLSGNMLQSDVAPFIAQNRTMVPIRIITEALGGTARWDGTNRVAYLYFDDITLRLPMGQELPGGLGMPTMQNARVFVPLRYVSEMIGADVFWDAANRAVYVWRR